MYNTLTGIVKPEPRRPSRQQKVNNFYNNDYSTLHEEGTINRSNNIDVDPGFVNSGSNNYHLKATSSCIDLGDNSALHLVSTDIDNEPRSCDGDRDGTAIVDIRADEYAELPAPDIKANGSDGPITVPSNQAVSITISLDPGCLAGQNADWWIAFYKPFDWLSYVYPNWVNGIQRCFEAPLVGFSSLELINSTFSPGDYLFCFVVDENADGNLDITWFDCVEVYVQQ